MPEKLDRCVADVKAKGGADNPWAVCNASIGKETKKSKIQEKVNENRQVPFFNPPVKKDPNKPEGRKTTKGIGGPRLNTESALWKNIFDAQLRRNVKEPKA